MKKTIGSMRLGQIFKYCNDEFLVVGISSVKQKGIVENLNSKRSSGSGLFHKYDCKTQKDYEISAYKHYQTFDLDSPTLVKLCVIKNNKLNRKLYPDNHKDSEYIYL